MFYLQNPDTMEEKRFSRNIWTAATFKGLLDYSFDLWNDRCVALHGTDDGTQEDLEREEYKFGSKSYTKKKNDLGMDFGYLFRERLGILCKRSTPYIIKGVKPFWLAKRVTR